MAYLPVVFSKETLEKGLFKLSLLEATHAFVCNYKKV